MTNFTIDQQTAIDRIDEWQQEQATIKTALGQNPASTSSVLDINAFTFKLEDLVEFINRIYLANNPGTTAWQMPIPTGTETTNAVRFYLGEKQKINNPNVLEPCLIATAVDNFAPNATPASGGQDVLNLPSAPSQMLDAPAIYDFSYPCPATCPETGHGILDS